MLTLLAAVVAFVVFVGGVFLAYVGATSPEGSPEAGSLMRWGVGIMVISGVVLGTALQQLLPS